MDIKKISPNNLVEAREQLHQAVQLVAAFARSYSAPAEDDHYASLSWVDGGLQTILVNGEQSMRCKLEFEQFEIRFLNEAGAPDSVFALDNITEQEIIIKIREFLVTNGFDITSYSLKLPYEISDYSDEVKFKFLKEECIALAGYFDLASKLLIEVSDENLNASEILCWPHHFDIATLITMSDQGNPETANSIGVGLSPGDNHYSEPYFYISPWPHPDSYEDLPKLSIGHWHTENFFSAILTATEFLKFENTIEQSKNFIDEAIKLSRSFFN